jgi:hypothetical protein
MACIPRRNGKSGAMLAYRRSTGEQSRAPVADRAAHAALLAAGGDPELAARDVVLIASAAGGSTPIGSGSRRGSGSRGRSARAKSCWLESDRDFRRGAPM